MLKVISFLIILYSLGSLVLSFAIYSQCGLNLFLLRLRDYLVLAKGEIFLHRMFTLDQLQANLHGTR